MNDIDQPVLDIPAHVPPHLVHRADLWGELIDAGTNIFPYAASLQKNTPPIFYVPKLGFLPGHWVPRRAEDLRRIFLDTETFSNKAWSFSALIGESWSMLPNESDPPVHTNYRALVNPLFAPKKIAAMEADVRRVATDLLDSFAAKGECDFIEDFAHWFPTLIFLNMMEWPTDRASTFVEWTNTTLKSADMQEVMGALRNIIGHLRNAIEERRANPGTDFTSFILSSKIDGRALTDDEVLGFCYLAFIGGLDTVASTLGFFFLHLAQHPEQQAELRANPEKIPDAVEELLRAYSVVNLRRIVTKDVQIGEATMRRGDYVLMSLEFGGLDEELYNSPATVDFNRGEVSPHMAFGYGPHRCVGSHLARRELIIALELWLQKIPPFRLQESRIGVRASGVFGLSNMHLEWDPKEIAPAKA